MNEWKNLVLSFPRKYKKAYQAPMMKQAWAKTSKKKKQGGENSLTLWRGREYAFRIDKGNKQEQ